MYHIILYIGIHIYMYVVLQNDSGDFNKRESEILKIYEQVTKDQQIFP